MHALHRVAAIGQGHQPERGSSAQPGDRFGSFDIGVASEAIKGTDYTSRDVGNGRGTSGRSSPDLADIHAAGTAGGGTAEGGLAGTNIGEGDPGNADLENAMGSGNHDVAIEEDPEDTIPYSGPSGGAVGGTPAGKRSVGGKSRRRGIVPSEDMDEASSG